MNIAAAVIPFRGAIKTFQAATSPAAICCVLRLDTIGLDWVDAQADLSLRWAHMPLCWFCHEAAQILFVYGFGFVATIHNFRFVYCRRNVIPFTY